MHARDTAGLLVRARDGSDAALDELLRRYAGKLRSLIRLRMGRELRASTESGDVLNATWLKAFVRIGQLHAEDGTSFMGWLARIAENEIHDLREFQRRGKRDRMAEVPIDDGDRELAARIRTQTSRVALREGLDRLERAMEQLETDHREVIVLRMLEELTFPEVAERMGRTPDACRMLFARAMTALTLRMRETT